MLDTMMSLSKDADPFGLRAIDFHIRVPERSEMFTNEEATTYITGCDFPESADDLLLAWELAERFGVDTIQKSHIMDAMSGPGRLGRELLTLGVKKVTFHDGHDVMLGHGLRESQKLFTSERVAGILSNVDHIDAPDNTFDMVVCHNSTHQLENTDKLQRVLSEFVRVTKPNGWIIIADYQRHWNKPFIETLEKRLAWTRPEIVPLLIPTFQAAFTKCEFDTAVEHTNSVKQWLTIDAELPVLSVEMRNRLDEDPVKGHELDFSPISCRVIIQKEEI